jgi:hypothetical protein
MCPFLHWGVDSLGAEFFYLLFILTQTVPTLPSERPSLGRVKPFVGAYCRLGALLRASSSLAFTKLVSGVGRSVGSCGTSAKLAVGWAVQLFKSTLGQVPHGTG